ncbi:septation regulator SpoVG [Qingrenia yutianensis]|uniref:Septation regulator SpoVG n=1 Tax=Qingrenia yutianensis TaxID=2763676 RepID=A0A926FBD6_9FIRM|nr:septation regulator SpoVG [Qingrenia yutianensis]MBC8595384.1 septation regulator SpoVG [Qingrenia yutianensis]
MNITSIKIKKFATEGKMRAIASITIDDCFAIHDVKVIENNGKVFVAMPNKRLKDGTFKDVAHPINIETRKLIEDAVIEAYNNAEAEE